MLSLVTAAENTPEDSGALRRVRARTALDAGDAAGALAEVDELPEDERATWLAEVWMLAGSPRAVNALLPHLSEPRLTSARAFVADPPRPVVPPSSAPDAYAELARRAELLAALGRAAELALTHLALSRASPRIDWRVGHLEHAAALAMSLGDARLSALVRAFEAERDRDLGEHDDAREAATEAIALGETADEPRAVALGHEVLGALPDKTEPEPEPETEPM